MGMSFYATEGTAQFMAENNIEAKLLHWPLDEQTPNLYSPTCGLPGGS
jgi:hypothetical protein